MHIHRIRDLSSRHKYLFCVLSAAVVISGYFLGISDLYASEQIDNVLAPAADQSQTTDLYSKSDVTPKLIYGNDNRLDEYQITDDDIRAAGDSTVAIIWTSDLVDNNDGTFSLPDETLAEWYAYPSYPPLCSTEPFRNQPNPAFCSGFLVAPDVVATAGHCINSVECGEEAFVFGFVMSNKTTPRLTISGSEIYFCSEIVAKHEGNSDWALIRLDRPVSGHTPLTIRSSGKVPDNEPLMVIGHPLGLPRKYSGGAKVYNNSALAYFLSNLDTYAGNSGSAVLNTIDLTVEGILVAGQVDWQHDADHNCDYSNVCPDSGCPGWEQVTRTTQFSNRTENRICKNTIVKAASNFATSIMNCSIKQIKDMNGFDITSCIDNAKDVFDAKWMASENKARKQGRLCCNTAIADVDGLVASLAKSICDGIMKGIGDLEDKNGQVLAIELLQASKKQCQFLINLGIKNINNNAYDTVNQTTSSANDVFERRWSKALSKALTRGGITYSNSGITMGEVEGILNTLSSIILDVN